MIVESGGGAGLCKSDVVSERVKEDLGIGREIMEPNRETLAIHFDDKRGSRVRAAADQ